MKPVIIGAGSCIIEAILNQFAEVPGLLDKVDLHLSQIVPGGRAPIPSDILTRATILIEEAAPWQGSGTLTGDERTQLPETATTIAVPTLHFNSLWPLMTEDPRNQPEPGAPYGRIPFGMGDRVALKIVQSEPDPAKRRALYDAVDLAGVANLARSHELEIRNCFAREQGCDVRVAAYVMANFREKRLYYTHNHPTGTLMYFVLAQLYALPAIRDLIKRPYDQLVTAAQKWAIESNVFGGEEAPVHPKVAGHFGLQWWRADHRYPWMGQQRNFGEWIDWYLRYVPLSDIPQEPSLPAEPETIKVGPYLAAIGDAASDIRVLTPQTEISRVPITVQDGLDPRLAPQGKLMNQETNGQYTAAATLAGALGDAIVLGEDGLVVHGGQLLGDTFRLFDSGLKAPVVREAMANSLILQSGIPTMRRHEIGPLLCGVAGGWRDYALWTIASMPRLVAFCALRASIPGLRVVLPRFSPGSFHQATLQLLGIGPEMIVEIGATDALHTDRLYVISALDLWQFSPYGYLAAQRIADIATPVTRVRQRRWVYLRGPDLRAARNAREVSGALAAASFEAIRLEDMALAAQIALMQDAECIIVEHGPAIANLLYARRGTPVLELFAPADPQPLGWTLASQVRLPYGFVAGRPVAGGGYEFPLPTIHAALGRMLLATTDQVLAT
jgi:hypothetical protein